ncbi:MAG: CvpA family protein [Chloroflexi bacterium]|nr:CvpA family protein [Chloroflexota bacterium]
MADLVFLGIFALFIAAGWQSGFVRRLAGLVSLAVAFVLGAYLREPIGALVVGFFPDIPTAYAAMVGYSVAFAVLVVGLNLLSSAVLSRVAVQGVSRALDKALGAALGMFEAAMIASAAIVILHTYSAAVGSLADLAGFGILTDIAAGVDASAIGQLLEQVTVPFVLAILGPLLPTDITSIVPKTIPGLPGESLPVLP